MMKLLTTITKTIFPKWTLSINWGRSLNVLQPLCTATLVYFEHMAEDRLFQCKDRSKIRSSESNPFLVVGPAEKWEHGSVGTQLC